MPRLQDCIQRGLAADRPAANSVSIGSLYYSTDSGVIERSDGTNWQSFSSAGVSGITQLTGDVTAGPGSGSQATVIPNGSITYTKIQNASATQRILARKSGGVGSYEESTISEILDFITGAVQGDILYRGGAGWARLPAGTVGQFLQTQGAGANPQWAAASGGGDTISKVRVEINAAALSTIFTNPVQLVAAPGADRILMPVMMTVQANVTALYTGSPAYSCVHNGSTTNLLAASPQPAMNSVTNRKLASSAGYALNAAIYTNYSSFDPRNKALMITAGGNPVGGTATVIVNLLYADLQVD